MKATSSLNRNSTRNLCILSCSPGSGMNGGNGGDILLESWSTAGSIDLPTAMQHLSVLGKGGAGEKAGSSGAGREAQIVVVHMAAQEKRDQPDQMGLPGLPSWLSLQSLPYLNFASLPAFISVCLLNCCICSRI
jgi:hypothetical protein